MELKFNNDYYFNNPEIIQKTRVKKKQIILINTGCSVEEHLYKISNRFNKKYKKIPTFTIAKNGLMYQHYDPLYYTEIIENQDVSKQAIIIAIENIGWLDFDNINTKYIDWRGVEYQDEIVECQWRLKKYWATYTNEQYLALIQLINYLCIEYSIDKKFVDSNIIINKPNTFYGILTRSNFSKNHHDLTPAFNFDKIIENEIN